MEQNNLREKHLSGFALRLTFTSFMHICAIIFLILAIIFGATRDNADPDLLFLGNTFLSVGIISAAVTALALVGAVMGRTCRWGNNLHIIVSSIFCLAIVGIFGVVGGVMGNKAIARPEVDEKKKTRPGFELRLVSGLAFITGGLIMTIIPLLTNKDDKFILTLFLSIGIPALTLGILETVCAFAGKKDSWANWVSIIFGAVFAICALGLFPLFGGLLGREYTVTAEKEKAENGTAAHVGEGIPLKVISIPDKEWKEYINQAPQDELLVLGIGMNLWLAKTRKNTLYFMLGLLASLMLGILIAVLASAVAGILIIAAGYIVFCTLCMRRHFVKTALNKTKSKLTAENKKALDAEFKTKGRETAAEVFITVMLAFVCEPYALGLALASAAVPSLMNTRLVIPEGYGFEALEQVKGYYAEKSFLSEVIEIVTDYNINDSRRARMNADASPADDYYKKDKYTYTDSHGYEQEVHSDDEKNFYDAGGHFQFEGEKQGDEIVIKEPKTYDD